MENILLKCGTNLFEGFVRINGSSYYFALFLPNYPSFEEFALKCDWKLKLLLSTSLSNGTLNAKAKVCKTFEDFFCILKVYASESAHQLKNLVPKLYSPKFYEAVHTELTVIGLCASTTSDFKAIKFLLHDEDGRSHCAEAGLPMDYPNVSVTLNSHDLPLSDKSFFRNKHNPNQANTLTEFHKRLTQLIKQFQPFWKMMENLDANCWILEPQCPRLSDTFRRIQISEYCSVLLTFNPFNVNARPVIEFRGKEVDVNKYKNLLEYKLLEDLWEKDVDVHLNLLSLLELDYLPTKDIDSQEKHRGLVQPGDCAICFEERLDEQTANQRCNNSLCNSQYHQVCLLKYLCSNLRNVRMKNSVSGHCPTCRDIIRCPTLSWDAIFSLA